MNPGLDGDNARAITTQASNSVCLLKFKFRRAISYYKTNSDNLSMNNQRLPATASVPSGDEKRERARACKLTHATYPTSMRTSVKGLVFCTSFYSLWSEVHKGALVHVLCYGRCRPADYNPMPQGQSWTRWL